MSKAKFDRSDLIALLALVISILGTVISMRETNILQEQQAMAREQKSATVWPHLDTDVIINYLEDSTFEYNLSVENNGIGPALLQLLALNYDSTQVSPDSLSSLLVRDFPDTQVELISYVGIEKGVLAPGETVKLCQLRITVNGQDIDQLIKMIDRIDIESCYCSVYDECYRYNPDNWPEKGKSCHGI